MRDGAAVGTGIVRVIGSHLRRVVIVVSLGILLIVLGFGSLLLPLFDIQFTLMSFMDDFQPWAGILVGVIGLGLIGWSVSQRGEPAPPPAA